MCKDHQNELIIPKKHDVKVGTFRTIDVSDGSCQNLILEY